MVNKNVAIAYISRIGLYAARPTHANYEICNKMQQDLIMKEELIKRFGLQAVGAESTDIEVFEKRFIALPLRNKGIGAIVSTNA